MFDCQTRGKRIIYSKYEIALNCQNYSSTQNYAFIILYGLYLFIQLIQAISQHKDHLSLLNNLTSHPQTLLSYLFLPQCKKTLLFHLNFLSKCFYYLLFLILKTKQTQTLMSQTQSVHDHLIKLLVVGDSGVGKTNMILRFCSNTFTSTYLSTIGIDLKVKTILVDGKSLKLQIWDTAGQERFRTITQTYYRGAMGIILVYAVNDRSSFEAIRRWYDEAEEYTGEGALKMMIGNKADSPEREVSQEEGRKLAQEMGIPFFETSAKNDVNIQTSFRQIGTMIKSKYLRFENSINVVTYTGSKLMRRQSSGPKRKRCC